jgi:hypothetical protein
MQNLKNGFGCQSLSSHVVGAGVTILTFAVGAVLGLADGDVEGALEGDLLGLLEGAAVGEVLGADGFFEGIGDAGLLVVGFLVG